jgi:hypothetical protein
MTNFSEDDEVINVQMPKGDYKVLREMIKDRKNQSWVWKKLTTFSLTLSGVIASWIFLGESIIDALM